MAIDPEIFVLTIAIALGGAVTGILAGLFGIGGGAIIVPVLYEVFRFIDVPEGVRMQLCIGTSLAIIVPTTVRSYRSHRIKGLVISKIVGVWAIPAIVGVAIGSILAAFAPATVFKIAFVIIALGLAMKLLLAREDWRLAAELPGRGLMSFFGFLVGLSSSLMGVSGGSVSNAILTLYGRSLHEAVAISAGVGVPISVAGTIGYALAGLPHQASMPRFSIGYISFIGFVLMAPISTLFAPLGASLAHSLTKRPLEIGFGIFLMLVSARFLISLV